jgi:hypothetical protein
MHDHATWAARQIAESGSGIRGAIGRERGAELGEGGELILAFGEGGVVELMTMGKEGELLILWSAEGWEQVSVQDVTDGGVSAEMSLWAKRGGGEE